MLLWLLFFVLGLAIGSFLNVVILHTHEGASLWRGRSRCASCHILIRAYDLVPVLSFLWLRGRCRGCHQPFSWQYPLVELATGLLFVAAFWHVFGFTSLPLWTAETILMLVRNLVLLSFLMILFVYDLGFGELPDRFTIPAIVIAFVLNLFLGQAWPSLLAGALVIGGFFLAQWLVSKKRWVGDGDIRLGVLMGAALGLWAGLIALWLAYVVGAIVAIFLLLFGKAGWKTQLPFGTFLTAATLFVLFFGELIWESYLLLFLRF